MSMTLVRVYETALQAIGDGMRITSAAEGTRHWFFEVGNSAVEAVPGGSPIVIDKETGDFVYPPPDVPSEILGEEPLSTEIEAESATGIPSPAQNEQDNP